MIDRNLPTVTVVTPAYNQAEFLRDTIESVLAQDYPNIEYVVLDDGSTDETPQILAEYGDRFRWESQQNIGQTATINKGWAMTGGEIITWLNSDDTYLPGAVSEAVEYLQTHPKAGIVFGDSMFTTADGTYLERSKPQPPFDYKRFLVNCDNTVAQPSSFIRRTVIEKVGELDPRFYYGMDWDFWLRAGLLFPIDYTPSLWSTYRLHSGSKTVAHAIKAAPELEYMYEKYFSRHDLPDEIRSLRREALMNMSFRSAGYYLSGGDRKSAARMSRTALYHNPLGMLSYSNLHKFLYCNFRRGTAST